MFESALLAQEQKALMRVIFLLRIACKEIDDDLLRLLGVSKRTATTLQTVFTKPKGSAGTARSNSSTGIGSRSAIQE